MNKKLIIKSNLKKLRINKGITQKEIAEYMGLSRQYISQVEPVLHKTLNYEQLYKLAILLECEVSDLFYVNQAVPKLPVLSRLAIQLSTIAQQLNEYGENQ